MKAVLNDTVLAESSNTIEVDGAVYFPFESVNPQYFRRVKKRSQCPWKGEAHYCSIVVNGEKNKDAAWYYPDPKPDASHIKNYFAFWRGVEIIP